MTKISDKLINEQGKVKRFIDKCARRKNRDNHQKV